MGQYEDAVTAITSLNGTQLGNRTLQVKFLISKLKTLFLQKVI